MSRSRVFNVADKRMDKFYDETPQLTFRFELFVTTFQRTFELYYKERLDGDPDHNQQVLKAVERRAQADMFNIINRLQADDPDAEFSKWQMFDDQGAMIKESNTLNITVVK